MKKPFVKKLNSPTDSPATTTDPSFKRLLIIMIVATLALFAGSGYYWYNNIFTNPDRIISDMLDKSLQTSSIERTVTQDSGQSKLNQALHINFTPQILAQSVTDLQETTSLGDTIVTTETIGTKNTDYVQYRAINVANNPTSSQKFNGITNTWGKRDANLEKNEPATFLSDALFVAVPFGNFNQSQRSQIKDEVSRVGLYKSVSHKQEFKDGRPVMKYTLDLDPKSLVQVLAKYAQLSGIGDPSAFNASQYEGASKIQIELTVDMLSRHLNTVEFKDSSRTETYGAYNARRTISEPTKTIGIDELQSRISGVEQQGAANQQ